MSTSLPLTSDGDAVEPHINVLKTGNLKAKENSAATLFSLSVIENNKVKIRRSGAVEPLVDLFRKWNSMWEKGCNHSFS